MEDVNAVYADGKMTFTVAHFSNYVIVDETVVKDNDNSNTGDDNQNNGCLLYTSPRQRDS